MFHLYASPASQRSGKEPRSQIYWASIQRILFHGKC